MILAAIAASPPQALAGGLVIGGGSPRAIGRAGTGTVGDDGGGALLVNPAAIARRAGWRAQLGVSLVDDEIAWQAAAKAPIVRNQAESALAPFGALLGSLGPWVFGAAVMTAVSERALRQPGDELPPGDYGNAYDFRYTGLYGAFQRDTATVGVARRLGDVVAIGLSVAGARVRLRETRRLWAGFSGRDTLGAPDRDVELDFRGEDRFVPSVVAGVMVAPGDERLELAASIAWAGAMHVAGDVGRDAPLGPRLVFTDERAQLDVEAAWTARIGGRYAGDRFAAELDGDLSLAPRSAARATWRIADVEVVDETQASAPITAVPSRASLRTHGAVRAAVDVELVSGFLWATAGYAYAVAGVSKARQSPTFGDLGGHTAALGLEGSAGGVTFSVGWSRTWSMSSRATSEHRLDNPFAAGDRAVPIGTYDGSVDQIGVLIDAELDTGP